MNWLLIFVNLLVFSLQNVVDQKIVVAHYLYPQSPQLSQFFTYAFLHANLGHVLGNMLFLYIFGNNVNDKLGNLGYLGFYLAGGVFAGIGYVLTQSGMQPVAGASGAVAAVTGAYLVLFPSSAITIVYYFLIDYGTFEVSSMFFIVFFFAKDLLFSFTASQGVAHTAHVFGSLFGFSVCLTLLASGLLPRDKFDILALIGRWNRRRQYRALVQAGYNPWDHPAVPPVPASIYVPPVPPDPAMQRLLELRAEVAEAIAHHNLPHAANLYLQLKQLDRNQVLSRQAQLDVANQLASQQLYVEAADAYEQFLRCFPNYGEIEQVQLILGLVYARYLTDYGRAKELLTTALQRLHHEREIALARTELTRIQSLAAPLPPPL
jgi:membrane associated rhomboid family serine protease